jgi:hypothetical protein
LENTINQLSQPQIEQLVATYAAFPLKRREIRRRIGGIISEEAKKRQLQLDAKFVKSLVEINGKDEKMKKNYC